MQTASVGRQGRRASRGSGGKVAKYAATTATKTPICDPTLYAHKEEREVQMRLHRFALLLPVLTAVVGAGAWAADEQHFSIAPDAISWGPMPPGLPPGAQSAVLSGDPEKNAPFVIRVKAPAGYTVPPHRHSKDEDVTVISGKAGVAMGETLSKDQAKALPAGGFVHMPGGMTHYAWSEEASIIQISGLGPFDITYANPKDDPRNQQGAK